MKRAGLSLAFFLGMTSVGVAAQAPGGNDDAHWLTDPRTGCSVFDSDPHLGDMAAWSGKCPDGDATGAGTVVFSSKGKVIESLSGNFTGGRVQDGEVAIKWGDGSSYEGQVVGGQFSGKGTLVTAAGDTMDGSWANNHLNGAGSVRWANGDRYEGDWRDGKSDGHGVQIWADGRTYDGQWRADQPNGHGVLTKKDGTRIEADFVDGKPAPLAKTQDVANLPPASPAPAQLASLHPTAMPATAAAATDASNSDSSPWASLAALDGKKLSSLDGSTIALAVTENSVAREIVAPNGEAKKALFTLVNASMGTVADEDDPKDVTGFFRIMGSGVETTYADGRSETLLVNGSGGLSIASKGKGGDAFCMAWYPEGHVFSAVERKAAVAEYADRLGVGGSAPASSSASCAPAPSQTAPRAAHLAKPQQAAMILPEQPVVVRSSVVHPIDGNAAPAASTNRASDCLHVESDGAEWGFRNSCGHSVQFSFCVKSGNTLAACDKGGVPGSVAPNGFAALFADNSLSAAGADHDFRWVACDGGAGEVVPHLDQASPPAGRCVRNSQS